MLKDKIVKVRIVKNYASARNHIVIGRVLDECDNYLILECRTIHFGKLVRNRSRIEHGAKSLRALPWHRVEVMHILDDDTDWESELITNERGYISLADSSETPLLKMTGRKPSHYSAHEEDSICEHSREAGI